jgi:hypothetical protein
VEEKGSRGIVGLNLMREVTNRESSTSKTGERETNTATGRNLIAQWEKRQKGASRFLSKQKKATLRGAAGMVHNSNNNSVALVRATAACPRS